ncbi:hypothetical protein SODG_004579 [Sodalis praecaptivus]
MITVVKLPRYYNITICFVADENIVMPASYPAALLRAVGSTCRFVCLGAASGMATGVSAQAAVVASLRPLGFIAAAVADGVMPVEIVLPDGASPHDYALRPTDALRLKRADVLVWVGPEMEAFLSGPAASLLAARRITLASLPSVKALLQKAAKKCMKIMGMTTMAVAMMAITTANIICICGCRRPSPGARRRRSITVCWS